MAENLDHSPEISDPAIEHVSSGSDDEASGENSLDTVKKIYDTGDQRGRLSIYESPDKSRAFMKVSRATEASFLAEDICNTLAKLGITTGIHHEAIENGLAKCTQDRSTENLILIAEGRPAADGQDAQCRIHFDEHDPCVEQNQKLLSISAPEEGEPGCTIYGDTIKPKPGKHVKITLGDHVIPNDDYTEFVSDIFGTASFENNVLEVHKILDIRVTDDEMEALLTYTGTSDLTRDQIIEELHAKGITSGIDNQAIDYLVSSFHENRKKILNFAVARGTTPKPGRDGKLKFFFNTSSGPAYTEKEDGSINIRETNVVKSVQENQELAELIPHIEPTYGKNVYGKIISAPKVKKVKLSAGKGVRVSSDGCHFFAETGGRPIVESEAFGDRISVNETFSIPGDLDLSVGNIDFDGIVEIGGDVEDGFSVKSTKTIIIHGIVGACKLDAGVDIAITGGCNGKNQAEITCGGNLSAHYLNECNVLCGGDITIHNEIVNSEIKALGRVYVASGGSARGGSIMAKKGIEAYNLGSDMGVKTVLIPGDDYETAEKCKKIDGKIIEVNNEDAAISKRIAPLLKNRELIPKLPAEQREKLKETVEYLKQLRDKKDSLNSEKNELITAMHETAEPEAVVHKYIYQGVIFKIGAARREISSRIEGPLRLFEENERVMVEPYFPDKKNGGSH